MNAFSLVINQTCEQLSLKPDGSGLSGHCYSTTVICTSSGYTSLDEISQFFANERYLSVYDSLSLRPSAANLAPRLEMCSSGTVRRAGLSTQLGGLSASQNHGVVLLPQILTLRASPSPSEGDVSNDTLLWPLRLSTRCCRHCHNTRGNSWSFGHSVCHPSGDRSVTAAPCAPAVPQLQTAALTE